MLSWVAEASPGTDQVTIQSKEIKCYPNPATSFINFSFPQSIDHSDILQIYSFTGRKMTETPVNSDKLTITLDNYYRGIYVYQLRDKDGRILESGKFQVVK